MVEWLAWLTCHRGGMAKLDDAGSNPVHEDGQFRTHVWSTLYSCRHFQLYLSNSTGNPDLDTYSTVIPTPDRIIND